MENIMTGNPLLNTQNNFKVKRRYCSPPKKINTNPDSLLHFSLQ